MAGLLSRPARVQKVVRTNAERCAAYRKNVKHHPDRYEQYLMTKKLADLNWRQGLTDKQKLEQREKDRLRQRKRRVFCAFHSLFGFTDNNSLDNFNSVTVKSLWDG